MGASEVNLVQQWHTLLNDDQVEAMVALVHPDVEVGGPRGSTRGAQVVREWFGRANARFIPLQIFGRDYTVVVEERGEWFSPDTHAVTTTQVVATVFEVNDGFITRIMRCDDLQKALTEAGLSESDKIKLK